MKVYTNIEDFKDVKNPIVTTGTFDGVHHGHQKLVEKINDLAQEIKGESVLITFDPHPRAVVFPEDRSLRVLSTLEEKILLLEMQNVKGASKIKRIS